MALTKELLQEKYEYRDGALYHKISSTNSIKVGDFVGSVNSRGYLKTTIGRKQFTVHRLIYVYHYGDIPEECDIDHIDGNKLNNHIENLRAVSRQHNHFNRTKAKGYSCLPSGGYGARIKVDAKLIWLGTFKTEFEARKAYLDAKETYHIIKEAS
ncbi:MAG: HNH endonuclease [Cycloclasticus sp.]|nr:HNH endonuclease [Cycloclasticus sp.]